MKFYESLAYIVHVLVYQIHPYVEGEKQKAKNMQQYTDEKTKKGIMDFVGVCKSF